MASPALVNDKGIDLPILNGHFLYHDHLTIRRVLIPFAFLQRQDEQDLIAQWLQVFNIETVNRCEKNPIL